MSRKTHITQEDIKYITEASPVGSLIPEFIGQQCLTISNKVFFAKGLTNKDWIEASGDIDLSHIENQINENKESISSISNKVNELNKTVEEAINGVRLRGIEIANSLLEKL